MLTTYDTIKYNGQDIKNILRRYIIKSNTTLYAKNIYEDYLIKNWESSETVSYKLYGKCDYDWAILLANNVIDPVYDWLLTDEELTAYISLKYNNPQAIHHYELNGLIYAEPITGAVPVTNFQYEYDKNEKKRKIRVIIPELIESVANSLLISAGTQGV